MQPEGEVSVEQGPAPDQAIGEVLASLIGQRSYDLSFQHRTRLTVETDELVVYAASPFLMTWIQKQYRAPLAQAARTVLGPAARLRFEVDANLAAARENAAGSEPTGATTNGQLPGAAPTAHVPRTAAAPRAPAASGKSGRRFADLADFVVGPRSALAMAAVREICETGDRKSVV